MEMYLLNSAACLAILLLFYKLLLENETMHQFKRFYLLGSVFIAFVIPFITFTTYVEVTPDSLQQFSGSSILISETDTSSIINWNLILWGIYGIGVLIFTIKFLSNLISLIRRIQQNPKLKIKSFINVLLSDILTPHTFFNYLFFNKEEFINKQIPSEVIAHEEAHARQLHSLDVLLMEILQIVLWFNPLIYLLKDAIKLNHEFLADQAVIKNGIEASNYQKILLAFSSNAQSSKLANAFNYSSTRLTVFGKTFSFEKFGQVKKRFKIMKTNTSRRTIWSKGLLLLPLLALLLYSFSTSKVIEREMSNTYSESLETPISDKIIFQDIATKKMVNEYNKLAKKYNALPKEERSISREELGRMVYIFDRMNKKQRDGAEKFPEIVIPENAPAPPMPTANESLEGIVPPPPPPVTPEVGNPAPVEMVAEYRKLVKYYNSLPQQPPIMKLEDANRIIYIYSKMSSKQKQESEKLDFKILPPPPPPQKTPSAQNGYLFNPAQSPPPPNSNTLEYVKELARRGANFYIGPHKYSPEEAIKMVKKSTNEISIDVSKYPDVILGGC
jgi:beta-lactamase regulating signal transducer with metallopeptidase domain